MYPTSIFGFVLVASGVLFVLRPERRFGAVVAWASALTFFAGLLGCAVGLVNTYRYAKDTPPAEQLTIALVGSAESLNNVILALLLCTFTGLLALIASVRVARAGS